MVRGRGCTPVTARSLILRTMIKKSEEEEEEGEGVEEVGGEEEEEEEVGIGLN